MRPLLLLSAAVLLATPAAAQDRGFVYAECAPLGNLADTVGGLLAPVLAQMPELSERPVFAALTAMGSRARLSEAGFDPEGALRLSIRRDGSPQLVFELGFAGDEVAAEAFLSVLGDLPRGRDGDGSWTVSLAEEELTATLEEGLLRLATNEAELADVTPEQLPPDWRTGGCGLVIQIEPDASTATAALGEIRVFVPTPAAEATEAVFRLRMTAPEVIPAFVGDRPASVAMGSSVEAPVLVATFGAPLLDILDTKPLSGLLSLPVLDLRALREAVVIESGATVALLDSPIAADQEGRPVGFALAMKVSTPKGQPLKPPHLARALKEVVKADPSWALSRISGRAYELRRGDEVYTLHLGKELLFVGTDGAMIAASGLGEGEPWAAPGHLATAGDWGVTLSSVDLFQLMGTPSPAPMPATLRLRTTEGLLEAELSIIGPGAVSLALGAASAVAIPNFVAMSLRAKRAEVPANVEGIRTAVLAYEVEHGVYPSAEVAPRGLGDLNGDRVAWDVSPEWTAMGWEADGKVRGVYWVEVSEDGLSFAVYGAADVDGDGIPCRYQATESDAALALTPPTVF